MEQEQVQEKKRKYKSGPKKKLSTIMNPLKTGEQSKYFKSPRVIRLMKDPLLLGELLLETIDKIQNEDLMPKERIVYLNVLANIYKAIFKVDLGSVLKEMSNKEVIADLVIQRGIYFEKYGEMLPDDVEKEIKEVLRKYHETKVTSVLSRIEKVDKGFNPE